jgi:hypothetical protein
MSAGVGERSDLKRLRFLIPTSVVAKGRPIVRRRVQSQGFSSGASAVLLLGDLSLSLFDKSTCPDLVPTRIGYVKFGGNILQSNKVLREPSNN